MRREFLTLLTILVILIVLPIFVRSLYILHVLIMALIWGVVAINWDFLMGYAGIFTFGQFAFFAFGAYGSGMITKYLGISPWIGILIGGAIAGLVGIGIGAPCLRLKGAYVALLTFALHLILSPIIKVTRSLTGGTTGLLGIPTLCIGRYVFSSSVQKILWYYTILIVSFSIFFAICKIINSPFGKSFIALRDSEDMAKSLGVNEYKCKILVFAISAFFTGIIGAFYAHYVSIISPKMLGLDIFLLVMVMLVVGGMGRFPGALIGAFVVYFLSEALRPLGRYRLVVFGAIAVLSVVFMPQGLMGIFNLCFGKKNTADIGKVRK